jgi:hypothetical protein
VGCERAVCERHSGQSRAWPRADRPSVSFTTTPGSPASQRATSWLGGNGPLGPGPKALRAAPAFSCRNACFHNLVACSTERDYDWVIPSKIRKGIYAARVLVCDATTRSSVHQAQTFLRSRLGRLYSNLGLRISIQPSSEGAWSGAPPEVLKGDLRASRTGTMHDPGFVLLRTLLMRRWCIRSRWEVNGQEVVRENTRRRPRN